ncbi:hypothetical protein [Lysobacter capsici]|uniref:hypothetical protein n=1 Tax=Lysobacter capsici TaxID=435897 RepID=UPI001BFFDA6F|nr:hypothetical protein [Lysobacter capsici]QWF15490.1 hypothetical protein KME82_17085 [Lysobacter capsici]
MSPDDAMRYQVVSGVVAADALAIAAVDAAAFVAVSHSRVRTRRTRVPRTGARA